MSLASNLTGRWRWLRRSSTLRLSLLLSAIFAIAMTIAIFAALLFAQDAVLRRIDIALASMASTTTLDEATSDPTAVIMRAPDDLADLPRPFERAAQRGGGTIELQRPFRRSEFWRVLTATDSRGEPVLIALPLDDSAEALEQVGGILWITVGLVVLTTLVIGLLAGLLAQKRVRRIDDTLNRLAAGDLTARTDTLRSRDDLDDIARQLDTTAGELERLVAQTRNLSASLAHDLRTPLARLRARLEMLPEGEARGEALEEASKLSDVFDTIMRVARIEAAHGDDGFETVDLNALIKELAEIFEPVIEDEGKALKLDLSSSRQINADRQMIVQAMANLIQNALVYGGKEITLFAQGSAIGVADNGDGVDPEQFPEIIKPMVRLDAARRSDGSGLGLALVRAVADRHSATLELAQNAPKGLRVTLNFAKM